MQFPDREAVDSQSDIHATIVLSIPRVTALRTLRRPVTAKPWDTRPDVRGKAPARAPCRLQTRQPPSGTIVVVRVYVCLCVWRVTMHADSAALPPRPPSHAAPQPRASIESREVDTRSKTAFGYAVSLTLAMTGCSTLNTRFVQIMCIIHKDI